MQKPSVISNYAVHWQGRQRTFVATEQSSTLYGNIVNAVTHLVAYKNAVEWWQGKGNSLAEKSEENIG